MKLLEFIFLAISLFALFGVIGGFATKIFEIVLFENHKLNHQHEILIYLFFAGFGCFLGLKLITEHHYVFLILFISSILMPIMYYIYNNYIKSFFSIKEQISLVESKNSAKIMSVVIANHPRTYLYTTLLIIFMISIFIIQNLFVLVAFFVFLFLIGVISNSILFNQYHLYNVYIRSKMLNNFKGFKQLLDSRPIGREDGLMFLDYACFYSENDPERSIRILNKYNYSNNLLSLARAKAFFSIKDYQSAYTCILGLPITWLVSNETDIKMIFKLLILNKKFKKTAIFIDELKKSKPNGYLNIIAVYNRIKDNKRINDEFVFDFNELEKQEEFYEN